MTALLCAAAAAAACALPGAVLATGGGMGSMGGMGGTGPSGATASQVEWVRSAASRFVTAELSGSGSGACAILYAPLRATRGGQTCEARWDARIAKLMRTPGARRLLRAQLRHIAHARVSVHGDVATIALATPLMGGSNRFVWNENCWMLAS